MRKTILSFCLFLSLFSILKAQTGCPGCVIDLPENMAIDTLYLGMAADGQVGEYYEEEISFRLPQTTTAVAAIDSTIPPGFGINSIEITALSNVPPGLSWEANATEFDPSVMNDGCVKFCGTPLQSGVYFVEVGISASVFVINQTTSFSFPIYIAPAVIETEGFTMENNSGCGSTYVRFSNNIPSNDIDGYSYSWDFGNGVTSTEENPAPQLYDEPGTYEINYEAVIDTTGYILNNVNVLEVGCSDIFGQVDLSVRISDPDGEIVFQSETIEGSGPTASFDVGIPIRYGSYRLEVIDRDSGINGADDNCGSLTFNRLSFGTMVAGDLEVILNITRPVETIVSSNTVVVYPVPDVPEVSVNGNTTICEGDTIALSSSYLDGIQWFDDNLALVGENEPVLVVSEAGNYSVTYQDENGCTASSEPISVLVSMPDAPEVIINGGSNICEGDTTTLSSSYLDGIQWFDGDSALVGENEPVLVVSEAGNYSVTYQDENGCTASSEPISILTNELPASPEIINENNLLSLSNGSEYADPIFTFQWFENGELLEDETSSALCTNNSGSYTVEVTNTASSCANSSSIEVINNADFFDCVSSINETEEFFKNINLYPNPVVQELFIDLDIDTQERVDLRLRNALGQLLIQKTAFASSTVSMDVSGLPKGVYLLELSSENMLFSQKVMVLGGF